MIKFNWNKDKEKNDNIKWQSMPIKVDSNEIIDSNLELNKIDSFSKEFALINLSIENYFSLENIYGAEVINQLEKEIEKSINNIYKDIPTLQNIVYPFPFNQGKSMLLINIYKLTEYEINDLLFLLKIKLNQIISRKMIELTGQSLSMDVLHSPVILTEDLSNQELLDSIIHQSEKQLTFDLSKNKIKGHLNDIINNKLISVAYQPVVELSTGNILGWEAFTQLPSGIYYTSPMMLFELAEEMGKLSEVEKKCIEVAAENIGQLARHQKIFFNIRPKTLLSTDLTLDNILQFISEKNLNPSNIVIEITDKQTIKDYNIILKNLDNLKKKGYLISIENVGSGLSNLWNIANLRPNYIKLDASLIQGINSDPIKRAVVESMLTFSEKISSKIIACGIETQTELSSLMGIGIHYGQGYYLSMPQLPKPLLENEILQNFTQRQIRSKSTHFISFPIYNIMETPISFSSGTLTLKVKKALEKSRPISGVVIVKDEMPIGLVMSYNLNKELGAHFGSALYNQRAIDILMDTTPLIFDINAPIERVAEEATRRDSFRAYDDIIITDKGKLAGIVSVQKILDYTSNAQIEIARGANPLTGLPGNVSIEKKIQSKMELDESISIIYADLDNFKVYNDTYGFQKGDEIILLIGKIMNWATKRHGNKEDFIGHVGGDDFITITTPEKVERICQSIIRCFRKLVLFHYNETDKEKGIIFAAGRDGVQREYPLISVSLSIVDCVGRVDLESISKRAAEVKKYAKSIPGNVYVRDRRIPLGQIVS